MANQLFLLVLLIDWAVAFAYAAPLALVGRGVLYRNPKLGIAIWLSLFTASVIAVATAIALACIGVFGTWLELGSEVAGSRAWYETLLISFGPWLALALGGILIAIADTKLEGLFSKARSIDLSMLGGVEVGRLDGYSVIELPVDFAYLGSNSTTGTILLTRGAQVLLSKNELSACIEHEAAHLRGRHSVLIRITNFAGSFLGFFAVTRAMAQEVSLLLELLADSKVHDRSQLRSALRKMSLGGREIAVRLGE